MRLKDSLQSERDTIVGKLIDQLPTLKKYGISSTGVETALGRIRTLSSKETAQKLYMIGKNKSHTRDNVWHTVRTSPFILIGVNDCFHPRWFYTKLARFLTFNNHIKQDHFRSSCFYFLPFSAPSFFKHAQNVARFCSCGDQAVMHTHSYTHTQTHTHKKTTITLCLYMCLS